jgi:hypothetical protein
MTCPCVIAMIDTDGSADPGEIPQLVRALVARADLTEAPVCPCGSGRPPVRPSQRAPGVGLASMGKRLGLSPVVTGAGSAGGAPTTARSRRTGAGRCRCPGCR